jgi:hypothetical protein
VKQYPVVPYSVIPYPVKPFQDLVKPFPVKVIPIEAMFSEAMSSVFSEVMFIYSSDIFHKSFRGKNLYLTFQGNTLFRWPCEKSAMYRLS